MAAKKNAKPKKGATDDIPEELADEIQEAVSIEDAPSKQAKSTRIAITHYEEDDSSHDVIDVTAKSKDLDSEDAIEQAEALDAGTEAEPEEPESDDHEWHLIDDTETPNAEETSSAEVSDEEDSPEWDAEKWQQANVAEDELEPEHPEWDEEKWQQANLDEEEVETPEWDEEKWQQANSESDNQEELEPEEAKQEDTELQTGDVAHVEISETKQEVDDTAESSSDDSEDIDHRSASQVALNDDEEVNSGGKFNLKMLPKRFISWWQKAKLRNSMVAISATALLLLVVLPSPRYALLNTAGVRATASVEILDDETMLPLRDVLVSLAGQEKQTNKNGLVQFEGVRLGRQKLTITKSAYDTHDVSWTIGVGSNNIEPIRLRAIGTSFDFKITDWLTGSPILNAEVIYGENSAFVDSAGVAKLNTTVPSADPIVVTVTAPAYAEGMVEISTTTNELNEVSLVLDRHHLFISKRDGKYGVYKIRADGSDEQLVLAGTGSEGSELKFDTSPSGKKSILVAVRDKDKKNKDGFVLSGLHLIDVQTGDFEEVDASERIDVIGWIGSRVIYVKVQAGASGKNPERHRLMSLDTQTGELNQIAASNYFNDVLVAKNFVFYAPSDAYKENPRAFLFRSSADGSNIDTVFEKNVWTILRTGVDNIKFDANQVWYEGKVDQVSNTMIDRPSDFTSRLYTRNRSGTKAAWVDIRDGKGTVILEDLAGGESKTIISQAGLRNPLVWLSDEHLIYRVVTSNETADYIVNVGGGDPVKISDVTDISGIDRWYYFY